MASATALPLREEIEYPASDGEPMAEADPHRQDMTYLVDALGDHFRDQANVYVTGNLFIYYLKGDPSACVAPDLFVVKGVAAHNRKTYKLWQERRVPCLVVEVTSRSTQTKDEKKKSLYARLGVKEYFRFDPEGEYLNPRLQGFRLGANGRYRRLRPAADGTLRSRTLGVAMGVEADRLRLTGTTGERLLRYTESEGARRAAETEVVVHATRAAQNAMRAAQQAAAREVAEERAEREAAARRAADDRAELEAAARRAADDRAEREAAARRALEEELARLRGE